MSPVRSTMKLPCWLTCAEDLDAQLVARADEVVGGDGDVVDRREGGRDVTEEGGAEDGERRADGFGDQALKLGGDLLDDAGCGFPAVFAGVAAAVCCVCAILGVLLLCRLGAGGLTLCLRGGALRRDGRSGGGRGRHLRGGILRRKQQRGGCQKSKEESAPGAGGERATRHNCVHDQGDPVLRPTVSGAGTG